MIEEKIKIETTKSRFSDAPWFEASTIQDTAILIGGAGGIGSWTALLLSRIGFPIYLYDDDTVESVNIAGQFYTLENIGLSKTAAVKKNIEQYTDNKSIYPFTQKVDSNTPANDIMISAFDNMEARKTMFDIWLNAVEGGLLGNNPIYIDGRMEAEVAQVYFVTPKRVDRYMKTLFDDDAVPDLNCSYKSTSHNGAIIGGMITSGLLNHLSNVRSNVIFRSLPFCVEYELPLLNFQKIM